MSDNSAKLLKELISSKAIEEIDQWIAKYPADQKQSAVMRGLMIIQEEKNHLTPPLMDALASYLDMPPIAVYEVATFYSMYEHKPHPRHTINVCTNISCMLSGSNDVVKYLENKLDVSLGGNTNDGRFALRSVECLGACVNAPMMQIDKDYHENLTHEKIDQAIEEYK
ncbi:NADH-quinone oxidoreductase subunit NuoE [Legionella sp. W05-934-2]|jgi:NADH-quinone oxidoreductase subunit E|uniref:NADH-quinone oxidoreductase subunit NuoE n=1 Tax=Legionella sp. W05-934-2 TaxID=1198649 RepID=UPI00346349AA